MFDWARLRKGTVYQFEAIALINALCVGVMTFDLGFGIGISIWMLCLSLYCSAMVILGVAAVSKKDWQMFRDFSVIVTLPLSVLLNLLLVVGGVIVYHHWVLLAAAFFVGLITYSYAKPVWNLLEKHC